nr:hypothetical protein [Tanacetum cinerariifolium]
MLGGNQNGYNVVQNVGNQVVQNAVQNLARAEGNANRDNDNKIRKKQKSNYKRKSLTNLQQASTSDTQTDKAPVYNLDGSAEVQLYDNCNNDEIFNMFTQEEKYTELLVPIPELHQVQQNDSNVISEVSRVEQERGIVEQHPVTVEETHAHFKLLYNNLAIEVEKVNTVNRKLRETNADLTTELARYKNQEKCFEIRAKFVRDFKSLVKEVDELLAKHKALELEIERLLRAVVSQDIMFITQNNSVVDTSNLQTKLERTKERFKNFIIKKENEYDKLWNDWINPFKNFREEKFVLNKPIKESVRTNPITVSQPHVITKKVVNSDSNGFYSTGVDITNKTKRPQPRSNTKNDRVPTVSKSSRIKNKEVEVEEHPKNLLLS